MKKSIFFLLAMTISTIVISQQRNQSICSQILQFGIYDYYEFKNDKTFDYTFKQLIKLDKDELETEYNNRTLNASIPLPMAEGIIPLNVGYGEEQDRYKRIKTLYENNLEINMTYEDRTWLYTKVANKDIINAWEKCAANPKDLRIEFIGNIRDTFTINLIYSPELQNTSNTKITGVVVSGVKLDGKQVFKENAPIKKNNVYSQKMVRTNSNAEATINVTLKDVPYPLTITLPAIKKYPKYKIQWFRQNEAGRPYYKNSDIINTGTEFGVRTGTINLGIKDARIYDAQYVEYENCGWSYAHPPNIEIATNGENFTWWRRWEGVPCKEGYKMFYEVKRGVCYQNCEDAAFLKK